MEEVFEQLKCSKQGLTTEEGEKRLQIFGPNKLEEKKVKEKLKISEYLNWVCLINETSCMISNVSKTSFFLIIFCLVQLKQESKLLKFLGFMWNPLSWVMEIAALMAIGLANGGVFFFCLAGHWHLIFTFAYGFVHFFLLLKYTSS